MESTDQLNKTTSPPPNLHHDVGKTPPPPTLNPSSSAKSNDDGDDDCSFASSSASSSPEHKSKKPPKPEATQPPPNQEMEHYRIPASVFERNKSSTAADWSVASNESLFSIHMGNMSFTNDQYLWRSGELTPPPASTSEQMFSYSAHTSNGGAADMRSRELGLAEATMLEVIKENEGRSQPSPQPNARRSAGSNHSNMSFAFSVAGGDAERIPSSVKSSIPSVTPQHAASPANNPEAQHDVQPPIAKEKGGRTRSKWLHFCCPCWSYCW